MREQVVAYKGLIFILLLALVLAGTVIGCGKRGKLIPRDRVEYEDQGMPVELRLYPPRQRPTDALGVDDAFSAMGQQGEISERDLTPPEETPLQASPTPAEEPEPEASPTPEENP